MTRNIDLGTSAEWGKKPVQIDIERLLTTRLLVQANSGGGKSFALRRLLEQLFGAVPQVVIDLDGEFATLREKFPYVLASAGAGGDCKVDTRSAALLARRILEHGFSTICDLSEMKKHDRVRFVRLFLEALMDAPRQATPAPRPAALPASGDPAVSGPQQRILDALAWLESVRPGLPADRGQLALLADASPSSSGYQNNLGSLRTAGLVDYPQGGTVQLTEAGRAVARAPSRAPTSADLHATLQAKLPRPLWQILEALIGAYPGDLSKDELADQVCASPTSSGYQNNLGRLRSLGFIDYPKPGRAMARAELFLED